MGDDTSKNEHDNNQQEEQPPEQAEVEVKSEVADDSSEPETNVDDFQEPEPLETAEKATEQPIESTESAEGASNDADTQEEPQPEGAEGEIEAMSESPNPEAEDNLELYDDVPNKTNAEEEDIGEETIDLSEGSNKKAEGHPLTVIIVAVLVMLMLVVVAVFGYMNLESEPTSEALPAANQTSELNDAEPIEPIDSVEFQQNIDEVDKAIDELENTSEPEDELSDESLDI